jgi:DNA mismatch endonuclease (patch repair protein)
MADIMTSGERRAMMSRVRSRNTKPELTVRRGLHALGFRYLVNDRRLPGTPDIVLPKWQAAVFVNGCFWHGHDCHLFKLPATRTGFWQKKIEGNRERDRLTAIKLHERGWRVGVVWECAIKGKKRHDLPDLLNALSVWIRSDRWTIELRGMN